MNIRSTAYKHYLLTLLLVILAFNNVDRLALGLLLQDIKVDLELSDTQLGFLGGIAFALFYSVMGIPIARWADRGNRVTIITLTTAAWSAAVALCGMAATFGHLLLIRIGVAVGEAGCISPAHSLIADYFNRAERPRALAKYMLGYPLSSVIGYFLAGWLSDLYGWRMTFVLLGLPGLVLALLAWFTLREPRRATAGMQPTVPATPAQAVPAESSASYREVWRVLWSNATFRHLLLCIAVQYFFGYGVMQWKPAFFIRTYGLETHEVGTWFALIYGASGILGTYVGGELASRYAANDERVQLKMMAAAYSLFGILSACIYLSPNHYAALVFLALATAGGATTAGPLFATIQTLVRPDMRAISIAAVYLFANLIGMGLGPLAAGALSDGLRPWFGDDSLRYALLILCPGYAWCGWHLWRASTTVSGDLMAVQAQHDDEAARGGSAVTKPSINASIAS